MDRFTKICLVVIIILLAVIVLRPMFTDQQPVQAAGIYEYDGFGTGDRQLVSDLNKAANSGWEVQDIIFTNGAIFDYSVVVRRLKTK